MAHMNWAFQGKDTLQQLFLWMRVKFGTLQPTSFEARVAAQLGLELGEAVDIDKEVKKFEDIDLHADPWPFTVGPDLFAITKEGTTKPAGFDVKWAAHRRGEQRARAEQRERDIAAGGLASPPSRPLLIDDTAPFLAEPRTKRARPTKTEK